MNRSIASAMLMLTGFALNDFGVSLLEIHVIVLCFIAGDMFIAYLDRQRVFESVAAKNAPVVEERRCPCGVVNCDYEPFHSQEAGYTSEDGVQWNPPETTNAP
jgi:hypothetical protein